MVRHFGKLSAGSPTAHQQTFKFECPNLPGFKNLAGLIPDFIEFSFLR
jgi:hypothetical protein